VKDRVRKLGQSLEPHGRHPATHRAFTRNNGKLNACLLHRKRLTRIQGDHKTKARAHTNWNHDLLQPLRDALAPIFDEVEASTLPNLGNAEWEITSVMDFIASRLKGWLYPHAVQRHQN
jgi:hypothetical protein